MSVKLIETDPPIRALLRECRTGMTHIDEDRIRGNESSVVLEKQCGGGLGNLADNLASFLLLCFDIVFLVLLQPGIARANHAFDRPEFASFLCGGHIAYAGSRVDLEKKRRFLKRI